MTDVDEDEEDEARLEIEPAMVTRAIMLAAKANAKADNALIMSKQNDQNITILEHDIFGNPNRPGDKGFKGEITTALTNQSRQNWAILMAILGLIGSLVYLGYLHGGVH